MRQFKIILIGLFFFIWILPLGAFIAPEQEEEACNGKRAICLCSHLIAKQATKDDGKQFLRSPGSANKSQGSSPSFGPDFIHEVIKEDFLLAESQKTRLFLLLTNQLYIRPIEHVPKA